MVGDCIDIMITALEACVDWTIQLFDKMDASGYLVAVFILTLTVSLILIPMRGFRVGGGLADAASGAISSAEAVKADVARQKREAAGLASFRNDLRKRNPSGYRTANNRHKDW